MARKKTERYQAAANNEYITEVSVINGSPLTLSSEYQGTFSVDEKNILELGCGRGEYTIALKQKFSDTNFAGVDIKGDRLIIGARNAKEQKLDGICFFRIRAEHLNIFFPEKIFDEIWIPFPDPHPGQKSGTKRLTSERFLDIYKKLLKDDGVIHLKTDCDIMYNFSVETALNKGTILTKTDDLYSSPLIDDELLKIQTTYEKRYVKEGRKIKYLKFTL